jgi:hypothetical protein
MDGVAVSARRAIVLAAGIAVAACAAAALAQDPASTGNYGGGTIVDPPTSPYGPGNMNISLRATGNGKVQILAEMGAKCGVATIKANATLAPGGAFSASGIAKQRVDRRRFRARYTITGTMAGANASGAASAKATAKAPGRRAVTCKTGTVAWGARRASGVIGTPGAAPPTARMYGNTAQRVGSRRHAIVLRISADGKRLTRALYTVNIRCGRQTSVDRDTARRNLPISANGKVSDVERFSFKLDRRTRLRTTERFTADIGSAGATGAFSIKARYIDIPSGRAFVHCRTGTVKWSAAR